MMLRGLQPEIFPQSWILFPTSPVGSRTMSATAYCFLNAMESEDSTIAHGLRRRDPALLDQLIEQHQQRLLRYLIYLTGNRELARDLFQETWIRVLERGHQFDGERPFSTWLFAVARNLTIDTFRKKRMLSLDGLTEDEHHAPVEPIDPGPLAWEALAHREQTEQINAALLRLPAQYREAVVLRFKEELSLQEISTITGSPLGTIKSRLSRGLNLLMHQLKEARP
jgi:RNA polymerase sigma-70 factor (ECF subfamily)